jgi:hypothetical protein
VDPAGTAGRRIVHVPEGSVHGWDSLTVAPARVKGLQKCLSRLMVPARDESREITCPH